MDRSYLQDSIQPSECLGDPLDPRWQLGLMLPEYRRWLSGTHNCHCQKRSDAAISPDCCHAPPGLPHQAINLSHDQPAQAIVARNDPGESERVLPYQLPGTE